MTFKKISFQGIKGAYSDLACRVARPGWITVPCPTFEDAIAAVHDGDADQAMLACENSLVGRVQDIHTLLPRCGLYITEEHFQRVEHCLLGIKGMQLARARRAHSHPVALMQVRETLHQLRLIPVTSYDTAGAAEQVAQWNRQEDVAVASALAAEIYHLDILKRNIEDASHNTTRFYIMGKEKPVIKAGSGDVLTTLLFKVSNVPSALYKALSGFAENNINITKLESYMLDGHFIATQFLIDVESHPEHPFMKHALEALAHYTLQVNILGVYYQSLFRRTSNR